MPGDLSRHALPRRGHDGRLLGVRDGAPRGRRRWWPPTSSRSRPARLAAPSGASGVSDRSSTRRRRTRFELVHDALRLEGQARRALGLRPRHRTSAQFDLVFCGDLLIHLKDPVSALQRITRVCRGSAIICNPITKFRARPADGRTGRVRRHRRVPVVAAERGGDRADDAGRRLQPGRGRAVVRAADDRRRDWKGLRASCAARVNAGPSAEAPQRFHQVDRDAVRRSPAVAPPRAHHQDSCRASLEELARDLDRAPGMRVLDYGCADTPYRRFFPADADYVAADLPGNPQRDARDRARRDASRSTTRASTRCSRPRCSSTSPTPRPTSRSATACCAPAGSCCSRPTGSWSTTPTPTTTGAGPAPGCGAPWSRPASRWSASRASWGSRRQRPAALPGRALLAAARAACAHAFALVLQRAIALVDRIERREPQRQNALVFALVARRP